MNFLLVIKSVLESIFPILPYLGGIALIFLFYRMAYKKGYKEGVRSGVKEAERLFSKTIGNIESRILDPSDNDLGRVLKSKPKVEDIRKADS